MTQYNKALSLLVAAGMHARAGRIEKAGVALATAATHPSFATLATAARDLATASRQNAAGADLRSDLLTPQPGRDVQTGSRGRRAQAAGEDLRDDMPSDAGDRDVQTGSDIDEDLSMMGLDGEEDTVNSDVFDDLPLDDDDEGYDMEFASLRRESAAGRQTASASPDARFARAMKNAAALRRANSGR